MSDKSKDVEYRLKNLENLREIVDLCERAMLSRTFDKEKGTLIAIANCFPRVYWRCMTPMKLVLNACWTAPLPAQSRYPLLYSTPFDKKGNLVRPENLEPFDRLEYVCYRLKETCKDLCCCKVWLLASNTAEIASLVKSLLKARRRYLKVEFDDDCLPVEAPISI